MFDWLPTLTHVPELLWQPGALWNGSQTLPPGFPAYFRSDLFDLRRTLMDSWAKFAMARPATVVVMTGMKPSR